MTISHFVIKVRSGHPSKFRKNWVIVLGNEKMYQLRRQRGLTQRQVAEAVGIRQSAYAMIESGHRHPRKAIEKRLADFFGGAGSSYRRRRKRRFLSWQSWPCS